MKKKKRKKRNKTKKLLLNEKKLGKIIKHALFDQPARNTGISITLYTGFWGMINFDLAMIGAGSPHQFTFKQWIYLNKKHSILVVSLEKKEGPLKVVLNRKNYSKGVRGITVRYGTIVLYNCGTFEEAFNWVRDWRDSREYTI